MYVNRNPFLDKGLIRHRLSPFWGDASPAEKLPDAMTGATLALVAVPPHRRELPNPISYRISEGFESADELRNPVRSGPLFMGLPPSRGRAVAEIRGPGGGDPRLLRPRRGRFRGPPVRRHSPRRSQRVDVAVPPADPLRDRRRRNRREPPVPAAAASLEGDTPRRGPR